MTQYISKSAIKAEIESLRRTTFTNFDEGVNATVQTLLEVVDTLEVKEVDLNEEIKSYFKGFGKFASVGIDDCIDIAKHFFELGMQISNKAQKGE